MRTVKCENVSFDADKAFYDLAMMYTQEKFKQALKENVFKDSKDCPPGIAELEFVFDTFYSALSYFSATDVDSLPEAIDNPQA